MSWPATRWLGARRPVELVSASAYASSHRANAPAILNARRRPEAMLGQAMSTSKAGSSPPAADSRVRAAARLSAKESDPHFDLVEQSLPDSCGARGAIAHDPIRSCSALLPGALSSGVRSL